MPGDEFHQVQQGHRQAIPARAWNAMLRAQAEGKDHAHDIRADLAQGPASQSLVLVQNNSGGNRARFDVLGIGDPIILPSANQNEFERRVALKGVLPDFTSSGRFVLCYDAIPDGDIGRAVIDGVSPGRLRVTPATLGLSCADAIPGDATCLQLTDGGRAQVLWHDAADFGSGGGSGGASGVVVDALFRIGPTCGGGGGCQGEPFRLVTNFCPATNTVEYRQFDPCTGLLGAPFCVVNPTDCCQECSCGAAGFLVSGDGFTGAFAGFSCGAAVSCCPNPVPEVACVKIVGGPLDGTEIPVYHGLPGALDIQWRGSVAYDTPECRNPFNAVSPMYLGVTWDPCLGVVFFGITDDPLHNLAGEGPVAAVANGVDTTPCDLTSTNTYTGAQFTGADGVPPTGCHESEQGCFTPSCFPMLPAPVSVGGGTCTFGDVFSAEVTWGTCDGSIDFSDGGFNSVFSLIYDGTDWSFACSGGGSIRTSLDADCIATITYTTAGGDIAIYKVDMSSGCCGTFTALLFSTTAPGDVPDTITVEGIGCPEGGGGSGSGGGGGGGIASSPLGTASDTSGTATKTGITVEGGAMLVVLAGCTDARTVASVTFAGQPLAPAITEVLGVDCEIWYLHVTATTTGSIVATTSDGTGLVQFTAREVSGLALAILDQTSGDINDTGGDPPFTGPTDPTTHAHEFALAGAMYIGAAVSGASWGATGGSAYTDGQSITTTVGSITYTLTEGWQILAVSGATPSGTYDSAGGGVRPPSWAAAEATFP